MTQTQLAATPATLRGVVSHYLPRYVLSQAGHLTNLLSNRWNNSEFPLFSKLPNELIHTILGLAATSSPESCRALCLVSSWARMLALPHLRPTIHLSETENIVELSNLITHPTTIMVPCHTHYTRNLFISNLALEDKRHAEILVPPLVAKCPNLRKIAITGGAFLAIAEASEYEPNLLAGGDLDVTILMDFVPKDLEEFVAARQGRHGTGFFSRVTHIYLTNIWYPYQINISLYSRLTHLAILHTSAVLDNLSQTLDCIRSSETLQMIVVVVKRRDARSPTMLNKIPTSLKSYIQTQRLADRRLYILETQLCTLFYAQWKEEADGGRSLWEKAAEFSYKIGLDCEYSPAYSDPEDRQDLEDAAVEDSEEETSGFANWMC